MKVRGLHHNAYRCRDSEETRAFYEDFLGLPLVKALSIGTTKTGRNASALHTFYEMADGSFLAFFEVPEMEFEFKIQHDFDLHIALEVTDEDLDLMLQKTSREGKEVRGPVDHGLVRSIYLRDPNGYVIELTAKTSSHDKIMNPSDNNARSILENWQTLKSISAKFLVR